MILITTTVPDGLKLDQVEGLPELDWVFEFVRERGYQTKIDFLGLPRLEIAASTIQNTKAVRWFRKVQISADLSDVHAVEFKLIFD